MCTGSVLLDTKTDVGPLELVTVSVIDLVTWLPIANEVSFAVKVQGPVTGMGVGVAVGVGVGMGVGVGVGDGLQLIPLFPQGVGEGCGVGVGEVSATGVGVAFGSGVAAAFGVGVGVALIP